MKTVKILDNKEKKLIVGGIVESGLSLNIPETDILKIRELITLAPLTIVPDTPSCYDCSGSCYGTCSGSCLYGCNGCYGSS